MAHHSMHCLLYFPYIRISRQDGTRKIYNASTATTHFQGNKIEFTTICWENGIPEIKNTTIGEFLDGKDN